MAIEKRLNPNTWRVEKIAVIGAGIVGVPMAAVLANSGICQGSDKPARIVLIQRNSQTSGWKVNAINSGKSPLGGIEPDLDKMVAGAVSRGLLKASHAYAEVREADVILVCVQTDRDGFKPDYRPMFEAIDMVAEELRHKPAGKIPLIIFESTLAPSSMISLIREYFAKFGLYEGRDIMLGNSPNRIMPGYLLERITCSDKIIGGLHTLTLKVIQTLYSKIVTDGKLYQTNSMTAEIVKTLENAYRDVRIAFSAEIARFCDARDIDFYAVREEVNRRIGSGDHASRDPNAVPSGGILIPTIGVGGHCLPKDGILLLWRKLEDSKEMSPSLILEARRINDESPTEAIRLIDQKFGDVSGKRLAIMGVAYRFNSEDTRNSPSIVLAKQLLRKGCQVIMHDPFVRPEDQNLIRFGVQKYFTQNLENALESTEVLIFCTAHRVYSEEVDHIVDCAHKFRGIFDGCNLFDKKKFLDKDIVFAGIGKGKDDPEESFLEFVVDGFKAVERGFANEIQALIHFLNEKYVEDDFNRVNFGDVQRLAETCSTGCHLVNPGNIETVHEYQGFIPRLVRCAKMMEPKPTHNLA